MFRIKQFLGFDLSHAAMIFGWLGIISNITVIIISITFSDKINGIAIPVLNNTLFYIACSILDLSCSGLLVLGVNKVKELL
jgi:hypothetical protein